LLSKQRHYDWGLRATKAVLRVAGSLKRAEPKVDEDRILMRALRGQWRHMEGMRANLAWSTMRLCAHAVLFVCAVLF
jgi:hypothetical protein